MEHLTKYFKLYLILFLVVFITIALIFTARADRLLKNNHIVVCGRIYKAWVTRSGNHIKYKFNFGGSVKSYNGSCSEEIRNQYEEGREFILIACQRNDADNNVLLEKKSDYIKYNIKIEDTVGVLASCY